MHMENSIPPVISVVGKSESGKTTLIEKLIPELKKRGYRIGVVKHAFHEFQIDQKGKDSWRHKEAGAETVVVSSPGRVVMVKDNPEESLDKLCQYFKGLDLVIAEGFKNEHKPRIEVYRGAISDAPISDGNHHLIALATDSKTDLKVPTFGLEDVKKLADLIEKNFLRCSPTRKT